MSNSGFSIIVPTFGQRTRLPLLLDCIASCSVPSLREVIVVENGPKADAEGSCKQTPLAKSLPVRYAHLPTPNVGSARNHGVALASGPWLLFLDDDIRLESQTLTAYAMAFKTINVPAVIGGTVFADYEVPPPVWLRDHLPPSAKGYRPHDTLCRIHRPTLLGGNLAVHMSLFREHGLAFDEYGASGHNAGMIGEETRFQARALAQGLPLYFSPDAAVHHWVPADKCSAQWLVKRSYRHGLTTGLATDWNKGARLAGTPLWLCRQLLVSSLRNISAFLGIGSKSRRLSQRLHHAHLRGMIAGQRLQKSTFSARRFEEGAR